MLSASIIPLPGKTRSRPEKRKSPARRIVIVGNGMACHRLCSELAQASAQGHFKVTVLAEEPWPAYDRVHLTEFLTHRDPVRMLLAPPEWYVHQGMSLRLNTKVTSIDPASRMVVTQSGDVFPYDNLVLATGSVAFVPPVPGIETPHTYVYRTLGDLENLCLSLPRGGHAAVLGGGLLGLEAARALQLLGMKVTVIEGTRHLLSRQLNADAACKVREWLSELGLDVLEKADLIGVETFPSGLRLAFKSQEPLDCDRLIVATGIRPRDELARGCGLNVGPRGGIVVDKRLRASKAGIYAIGECAAFEGPPYGLAAPGFRMAECLAAILQGKRSKFSGGDMSTTLKVMGMDVHVLGEPLSEGEGITFESDKAYRYLVIHYGRILGAISIGPWDEADKVRQAILNRKRISPWGLRRFARGERIWKDSSADDPVSWPLTAQVCHCNRVGKSVIAKALDAGCTDLDSLVHQTRAGAVCGGCRPVLQRLLDPDSSKQYSSGPKLGFLSFVSAFLALAWFSLPSWHFAQSVADRSHHLEFLWRDEFWHLATGYALLSVFILALLLPLRKRLPHLSQLGSLAAWRYFHAILGCITLMGVQVHTGGHLGHGLNYFLALTFGLLNGFGALAGWALTRAEKTGKEIYSNWKTVSVWAHILLFWPMPILIGLHIWLAYAY